MSLRLKLRLSAILLIAGGLLAGAGEIVNILNNNPLSSGWFLSIGLIVLGTIVLIYGASMYAQLSDSINLLGLVGVGLFFLGGLALIVGTIAIDGIVLPLMLSLAAAIAATINSLGSGVQNAANTVSSGLTNVGNQIANAFSPGSGNASIPSAQIPQVNGLNIINSALAGMHLPTLDVIGNWGHLFLSGGPLAVGSIVLGLSLLRAKNFPRLTAQILIACAGLNLLSQVLTFIPVLGNNSVVPMLGNIMAVLLFLALAWLGISVLFPQATDFRLPSRLRFHLPSIKIRAFRPRLSRRAS